MLLAVAWRVRADRLFAFSPTYGLLLQLARRLLSLPLVVFIRADSLENHRLLGRPNWLIAVERRLERIGLKCEAIYCVSRSLCDVLRERHGAYLPLKVLPNDIPAGVVREKTYSNILRMAMVGVIEPRKGQVFLLHALSELGGLHWRIDVYGDGPDRDEAECIVRQYGLEDKVHFHGWVSREQLWSCTDLLLFPSRHEGAPNAVLESLAAQVPVLGSDIAEMREVLPLPDLIDATSADEWLARVALLLRNRDVLGEMSERQSRYAATYRFDWDDSVVRAIVGSET